MTDIISYNDRLGTDQNWAWQEGGLYFEERGAVQTTLRRVSIRLHQLGIPYAVVGALALFRHGYRRFTIDIDLLVSPAGLRLVREHADDLGLVLASESGKKFRDAQSGVGIDLVVTGEFPGNGKFKPVAFPDPTDVAVMIGGLAVIALPKLFDLKIAAGMTNLGRLKHLADVIETIKVLGLPAELADELDPSVRPKYLELWDGAQLPDPFEH